MIDAFTSPKLRRLKQLWLFTIVCASSAVMAEMPRNQYAARDAEYPCVIPQAIAAKLQRGQALARHKYNKNSLACAADILLAASDQQDNSMRIAAQALRVHVDYMDEVGLLKKADIAAVQEQEWQVRLKRANNQAERLLARLGDAGNTDPDIMSLKALTIVLIHQFDNPIKVVSSVRQAIDLLERATEQNPNAVGGWAMIALGRIYYEIPGLLGGDSEKALQLYLSALRHSPNNIQLLRYIAESYDGEMEENKALLSLAKVLSLKETFDDIQLFSDELRLASGLAFRLGDEVLASRLTDKRVALLRQYPQINQRLSSAAQGHGGVNPITGEPQD